MRTFKEMFDEEMAELSKRFPNIVKLVRYAQAEDDDILKGWALSLTDMTSGDARRQQLDDIRAWIPSKDMNWQLDAILDGVAHELIW